HRRQGKLFLRVCAFVAKVVMRGLGGSIGVSKLFFGRFVWCDFGVYILNIFVCLLLSEFQDSVKSFEFIS
ncbi:hypothetical protein, partial [Pseudomonas syringae group genomosp. 7]|uniref:hypothetical protein n=1 Tax=Pseudomonas syringae group genomosp. 7 TaxID=251699 RepID=UPI00376FEE87